MLKVYNNVFTYKDNLELYNSLLYKTYYTYGEADVEGKPPTGVTSDILPENPLFKVFYDTVLRNVEEIKNLKLQRVSINLFLVGEKPYYHNDGNVITCLFYISPEYDDDEGGETQFLNDDNIIGIKAKPGRLVVFDGKIVHRATTFRNNPRITVALKFIPE